MSFSYATDEPPPLSVDDVLGLIDWKEMEMDLASPDDVSRPPTPVAAVPLQPQTEMVITSSAKPQTPARRSNPPRRAKTDKAQTPTTTKTPVPPGAKPPAKKRIRREIVELKFLRGKVKELEEELRGLQLGCAPAAGGERAALDGLLPSVWTSMAGRQLKDRMRAERENQELRNMLQDQLQIAQGLQDTLKQLPANQCLGDQPAATLPPDIFGPASLDTLEESLRHLEQAYSTVNETYASEGMNQLAMDNHEIKVILHPTYGTCIRFTTRIGMPFNFDITSRVMWRFTTQEGIKSLATSVNKIYATNDIHAHCFAFHLEQLDPAQDYWMNQVVRKYEEGSRTVIVGRSTIHPYVKDVSCPTGVSFVDDSRVVIQDCSSEGRVQTCVSACAYLVPDFGDSRSDEAVGISDLSEFFVKCVTPVIMRCRETIQGMLRVEQELSNQTAVCV